MRSTTDRPRTIELTSELESKEHHVSFTQFFIAVTLQTIAAVVLFRYASPAMFAAEIAHPWRIVLWTLLAGLPISLFEYLYHRYLLHSAILPFMASMHRAHTTHHGLTYVKAPVSPADPGRLVEARNEFPIEEPHQEESMMFPLYSLAIFYGVFFILLTIPFKLMFPNAPIVMAVIFSVTLNYSAYEIWHAILHLPFDRFWKPRLESVWTKRLFRRVYGFHLMHHWRPSSNLAIVGFWGIAVWDHAFKTHRRPERLPLHGEEVNFNDATLAKPLWPISQLDSWQSALYRASRSVERYLAKVFLRRGA